LHSKNLALIELNFPKAALKLIKQNNKVLVWDIARKKNVVLTPEEWVRQHLLHYLVEQKKYSLPLIAIEKKLNINNTIKRFDILIYNKTGLPLLLAECKAPSVNITENTFYQIAAYNRALGVKYFVMTNGLKHFCCQLNYDTSEIIFLNDIPENKKI
jgi:hypothetical protein